MDEQNEMVTKSMFIASMDHLARLVNTGFMAMEEKMAGMREDITALTQRVDAIEKELRGMHQIFDAIFAELREIRNQIKEIDTRDDVVDLQIRVAKIEKKVGLK